MMATVEPAWKRPPLDAGQDVEPRRLGKRGYAKELERLQVELARLQEWIVHEGLKVVVIFEGRDTAGKGGTIKRITEKTNPRVVRTVALGTPTERERGGDADGYGDDEPRFTRERAGAGVPT